MKKRILLILAMLATAALLPMAAAVANGPSDETAFVLGINALRAGKGLPALTVNANLTSKARAWAQTMADKDTIWHSVLSDGITADWQKLGENVGRGGTVAGLELAFINSPHHYDNLVDPAFDSIGLGVVRSPAGIIFVAEEFMQLRRTVAAVAAPAIVPAPIARAAVAPVAVQTPTTVKAPVAVKAPIPPKAPVAVKTPVTVAAVTPPVTAPVVTPVTAAPAVETPVAVEAAAPLVETAAAPAAISDTASPTMQNSSLMATCRTLHCSNIVRASCLLGSLFLLFSIRNCRRSPKLTVL